MTLYLDRCEIRRVTLSLIQLNQFEICSEKCEWYSGCAVESFLYRMSKFMEYSKLLQNYIGFLQKNAQTLTYSFKFYLTFKCLMNSK